MNIWLDDEDFIEICSMAPYADEVDIERMEAQVRAMKWNRHLEEIQKERGYGPY